MIFNFNHAEFLVEELKLNETIDDAEIRSMDTKYNSENAMIHVPIREILSSSGNNNPVRMTSLLFRNMSGLLPERLHEETGINRSDRKVTVIDVYSCCIMQSI